MTYGNLFSKLLREDLKRRAWAVALTFLAFFFCLPIGLALSMENAENNGYRFFNDYMPFFNDGAMSEAQYQEKLLSLRTDVVMSQAGFGSGLVSVLLIITAVVIGVSSFAYLHNRQKVDFYHSIPVRREMLFGSQFMGGVLITGLAYGVNLILLAVVALAYGVPLGNMAGALAGGWTLNMLYFILMYATVAVAMMMTGNIIVGILASGIFFFFLPGVMFLISAYCETFFVTTARYLWSGQDSPFWWGIKYFSPFCLYMVALSWDLKELGSHVPELFCSVAAMLALTLLALQLYRIRPSEAAGRAMAFKASKSPIRMLMVVGFGLAGGIFFWVLQSKLKWGLFGAVVSVILSHCVIEIIYNFDFKKLFSNKVQLGLGLAVTVLLFLSFRFDWYGYDSYIPKESKVASVSLDVEEDHEWIDAQAFETDEKGNLIRSYPPMYEYIEKNMKLTDMDAVMAIVRESRDRTLAAREMRLEGYRDVQMNPASSARAYSVIGGADGPTSVFLAGKLGDGSEEPEEKFYTTITVCYEMKDGRKVRREYQTVPLSAVIDAYRSIYSSPEYKTGVYTILSQNPQEVSQVLYHEADQLKTIDEDRGVIERILSAYQADLTELPLDQRMKELPVGRIGFVTQDVLKYLEQETGRNTAVYPRAAYSFGDMGKENLAADCVYFWPVYPSFRRTAEILREQGLMPGTYFVPERADSVVIQVEAFLSNGDMGTYGGLPEGEELKALQRVNPNYREDGYLEFKDSEDIETLMRAMAQENCYSLNHLYDSGEPLLKGLGGTVVMEGGRALDCIFTGENVTPQLLKLFEGIPVEEAWELKD